MSTEINNSENTLINDTIENAIKPMRGEDIDITSEAKVKVSSYKYGYPPNRLIDGNLETFWQSEGTLPHLVNLKFFRQIQLSKISIYFDFPLDESYTPDLICIAVANDFEDFNEIKCFNAPMTPNWTTVDCRKINDGLPIPTYQIQIRILNNHEDGRDSHIRQIKVFEFKTIEPSVTNFNSSKLRGLEHVRI